jgi:hypothetical protein
MCDFWGIEKKTRIKPQPSDREHLEKLIANRNTPQKHVWCKWFGILSSWEI